MNIFAQEVRRKCMKNKILIISIISVLILIVGGSIILNLTEDEKSKITKSYTSLTTTDHVFDQVTIVELDYIIADGGTIFAYFGAPICPGCVAMVPELDKMAKEFDVDTIYYVHFEYNSDLAGEWYREQKYDYQGTPLTVVFKDGDFVRSNFSNMSEESNLFNETLKLFYDFS